jgi:hypothetical protein
VWVSLGVACTGIHASNEQSGGLLLRSVLLASMFVIWTAHHLMISRVVQGATLKEGLDSLMLAGGGQHEPVLAICLGGYGDGCDMQDVTVHNAPPRSHAPSLYNLDELRCPKPLPGRESFGAQVSPL